MSELTLFEKEFGLMENENGKVVYKIFTQTLVSKDFICKEFKINKEDIKKEFLNYEDIYELVSRLSYIQHYFMNITNMFNLIEYASKIKPKESNTTYIEQAIINQVIKHFNDCKPKEKDIYEKFKFAIDKILLDCEVLNKKK